MHRIRPIAICVFSHRGRILVMECTHPATNAIWYRPLGGGIEFGERAIDTLHREMHEEIDAELKDLRYLGMLENIFTPFAGEMGHEIVLVFDGAFVDATLYTQPIIHGMDNDVFPIRAMWKRLDEFSTSTPVYPDGLIDLLRSQT